MVCIKINGKDRGHSVIKRKENPSALLVGTRLVQPLWKTVRDFLRKLKMNLILLTQRFHCWDYIYPKSPGTPVQKNLPFATAWMELESIMLSEISQAMKNKYHMISPIIGT